MPRAATPPLDLLAALGAGHSHRRKWWLAAALLHCGRRAADAKRGCRHGRRGRRHRAVETVMQRRNCRTALQQRTARASDSPGPANASGAPASSCGSSCASSCTGNTRSGAGRVAAAPSGPSSNSVNSWASPQPVLANQCSWPAGAGGGERGVHQAGRSHQGCPFSPARSRSAAAPAPAHSQPVLGRLTGRELVAAAGPFGAGCKANKAAVG